MTFVPQLELINAITLGQTTFVGFVGDHDYIVGEIISFRISPDFGTIELNNQQGLVLEVALSSIVVDIDSTFYRPFIYPVAGNVTPPYTVPVGSGIVPGEYVQTVTLGCPFDDIPPI